MSFHRHHSTAPSSHPDKLLQVHHSEHSNKKKTVKTFQSIVGIQLPSIPKARKHSLKKACNIIKEHSHPNNPTTQRAPSWEERQSPLLEDQAA